MMRPQNTVLKSLDVSDNQDKHPNGDMKGSLDGAGFAKELAVGVSANGALVSANLLNNGIDAEQAQNLAAILKEHATLKSLCGNKGDETELDMSGQNLGGGGAIMLAPEIVANGALENLHIGANSIPAEKMRTIAQKVRRLRAMADLGAQHSVTDALVRPRNEVTA